ncbi:hypothetical protein ACWGOE_04335 [Leucobacter chromiiresistens]
MPTRIKKQRRQSGVKFSKAQKTPTPLSERREFRGLVRGAIGTKHQDSTVLRSPKKLAKVREAWGLKP